LTKQDFWFTINLQNRKCARANFKMNTLYSTKATRLGQDGYGCRVFYDSKLILEGKCKTKEQIGPTFRDLLRTLDKMGGDRFTSSARKRKDRIGNESLAVKHVWHWGNF